MLNAAKIILRSVFWALVPVLAAVVKIYFDKGFNPSWEESNAAGWRFIHHLDIIGISSAIFFTAALIYQITNFARSKKKDPR